MRPSDDQLRDLCVLLCFVQLLMYACITSYDLCSVCYIIIDLLLLLSVNFQREGRQREAVCMKTGLVVSFFAFCSKPTHRTQHTG